MQYAIEHGSCAALIKCNGVSFVYPSAERPPGHMESGDAPWRALPLQVQQAIQLQFAEVFQLPNEERTAYLKTLSPLVLDIPDSL
jgi:hypothetical protein